MKLVFNLFIVFLLFMSSGCDNFSTGDSSTGSTASVPDFDSNGPINHEEITYFLSSMHESVPLTEKQQTCLWRTAEERASLVGDPQTLAPTKVDLLPVKEWQRLGKSDKRLILTQVIVNQAILICLSDGL